MEGHVPQHCSKFLLPAVKSYHSKKSDSHQRTQQALTYGYKNTPSRADNVPDMKTFVVINEMRAY